MALYSSGVEYGLHCLLYLVDVQDEFCPSSRELAEFQGVSPSYVAKLFTQLEKAKLVVSQEGIRGGFKLAKPAADITVLDVVDAIEGEKPLFKCREVRRNCILFEGNPPDWSVRNTCQIHGVMLKAEQEMRKSLATQTLATLSGRLAEDLPAEIFEDTQEWFAQRKNTRKIRAGKSSA